MQEELLVFKACADPTRLRILCLLVARELCVCELVEVLKMPQGKISRHLALLKQARWVIDRREGIWIYYSLRPAEAGLKQRLLAYLREEAVQIPVVAGDLEQLYDLALASRKCDPGREDPRLSSGVSG